MKQVSRRNSRFADLPDHYFSNGYVAAFDATHNRYKLNYVYSTWSQK